MSRTLVCEDQPVGLHVERLGNGPRLVLVHGFTQTGRSWGDIGDLARDHEVLLVDAPGHGGSSQVRAGLVDGAHLMADAAGSGPATWIGYSMGARWCLHVAAHRPEHVAGLVTLGGTAGIEDPTERAARRDWDLATSERLGEVGLDRFLEEWLDQPLFAGLPPDAAALEDRRRNTVEGLRSSLDLAGTGSQEPLWDRLAELDMPVLALAGERDERYRVLAERMALAIGPNAATAVVPDAGHAAHLEQPHPFIAVLRSWLTAHDR